MPREEPSPASRAGQGVKQIRAGLAAWSRERRQTNEVRRCVILRGAGHASALDTLDPDAIGYVADTDKLLTGCSCSASDDQPY